jgi:hypothetical protein
MTISTTNSSFVRSICYELGNRELFTLLFEGIECEMTIDNIFARMKFGNETRDMNESNVESCSSHLFEIEESKLNEMSFEFYFINHFARIIETGE